MGHNFWLNLNWKFEIPIQNLNKSLEIQFKFHTILLSILFFSYWQKKILYIWSCMFHLETESSNNFAIIHSLFYFCIKLLIFFFCGNAMSTICVLPRVDEVIRVRISRASFHYIRFWSFVCKRNGRYLNKSARMCLKAIDLNVVIFGLFHFWISMNFELQFYRMESKRFFFWFDFNLIY